MYLALDIGGVCVTIDQPRFLAAIHRPGTINLPSEILPHIEDFECGRIPQEEFAIRCIQSLNFPGDVAEYLTAWNVCLTAPIEGTLEVIQYAIQKGITPVFFSDTSDLHLGYIQKHFPIAKLVARGIFSHEIGARKPSSKMYQAFEEQYGKPVLYVDDRPCNIEGAKTFRWNSLLFHNALELKKTLEKL